MVDYNYKFVMADVGPYGKTVIMLSLLIQIWPNVHLEYSVRKPLLEINKFMLLIIFRDETHF
jgi:hypothetical protein